MKKFLSLLLAAVMLLALFAGAASADANTDTSQTEFHVVSGISALSPGYNDNLSLIHI